MMTANWTYEKQRSIDGWQRQFAWLYERQNRDSATGIRFALRLAELAGLLTSTKHQRRSTFAGYYARYGAWSCALASWYKLDLNAVAYEKFPEICPYCQQSVCQLTLRKPSRTHGEYDRRIVAGMAAQKLKVNPNAYRMSFEGWSELILTIYPRNWDMSEIHVGERFHEENSELFQAVRRYESSHTSSRGAILEEIKDELADTLSWYVILGRSLRELEVPTFGPDGSSDLDGTIWDVYKKGCARCHQRPCRCTNPDVERLSPSSDSDHVSGQQISVTQSENVVVVLGRNNVVTQKLSNEEAIDALLVSLGSLASQVRGELLYGNSGRALADSISLLAENIRAGSLTEDVAVAAFARVRQTDFKAWTELKRMCTHALDIAKSATGSAVFEAIKYGLFAIA